MGRLQERADIEAAITKLNEGKEDYSLGDIAALTGLRIEIVNGYVHHTGCWTDWAKMWNQRSQLGHWELND